MDPALREIWAALQIQTSDRPDPQEMPIEHPAGDPTPESLRDRAYILSSMGERREAADMLRRALGLAETIEAESSRMIPLMEALAEVLWQLGEKAEARTVANRAIELWFSSRPRAALEVALETEADS